MIVALKERGEAPLGGAHVGEFGEKLRKQREQRGITLESVSNTTKIGTRMLKALEDERFDQLPGGVFNKGFVRAYARQIGLDAEEAVSDYLAALRESQAQAQAIMPDFRARPDAVEPPQATTLAGNEISAPDLRNDVHTNFRKDVLDVPPLPQPDVHQPDVHQDIGQQEARPASAPEAQVQVQKPAELMAKERPRKKLIEERPARPNQPGVRIPWGIVAAGLLVLALLLAVLSYHPRGERNAASQSVKPAGESGAAAASPASGKSPGPSSATIPAVGVAAPASSSAASAESSKTAPSATRNTATDDSSSTVHPATPVANPPSARSKAPKNFTLLIRAEQTSWVSITADGKPVAQETLIAPAGTSVRATLQIVVQTRNAGGLVFVLNGKTLPRQGEPGESRTFQFDANGVHVVIPLATTAP
jgi:cytoskeletal protein RodZ